MPVFAVTTGKGPSWQPAAGIREQRLWDEHAAFADRLVDEGFIVFGGPVHDADDAVVALLAVNADHEDHVHTVFAADPWVEEGVLVLRSVRRWTIWLGPQRL